MGADSSKEAPEGAPVFQVTIPNGASPGSVFQVQVAQGVVVPVKVPPEAQPGQSIQIWPGHCTGRFTIEDRVGKTINTSGATIDDVEGCTITGNFNLISDCKNCTIVGSFNVIKDASKCTVTGDGNTLRDITECNILGSHNRFQDAVKCDIKGDTNEFFEDCESNKVTGNGNESHLQAMVRYQNIVVVWSQAQGAPALSPASVLAQGIPVVTAVPVMAM